MMANNRHHFTLLIILFSFKWNVGYYIRDIGYGTVKPNDSEGNDGDVFITYF